MFGVSEVTTHVPFLQHCFCHLKLSVNLRKIEKLCYRHIVQIDRLIIVISLTCLGCYWWKQFDVSFGICTVCVFFPCDYVCLLAKLWHKLDDCLTLIEVIKSLSFDHF